MPAEKIVATTLSVPEPHPPQGMSQYDGPISWVISAAGGLLAASFWFRRRMSRDTTEIVKDRAEANLVQTLREERDRAMNEARDAWARRTTDAQRIAGLEAENRYLKQDVDRLSGLVNEMQLRLDMVTSALVSIRPDIKLPPLSHPLNPA